MSNKWPGKGPPSASRRQARKAPRASARSSPSARRGSRGRPRALLFLSIMSAVTKAERPSPYQPKNKVRIVTATSLFDGHDAAVNIMRRVLQASGAEVIHLGHNRSVQEIVNAALQEDVQGVAITSYQGGHVEFFKYMMDLLRQNGGDNIKVFGGDRKR